jgi:NTP pyrophosphatase (non-canonical NTP hydrolase)
MTEIQDLSDTLRKFAEDRYWQGYHTPENLAKSISIEAGELLECFQWNHSYTHRAVYEEMADVFIYLVQLADTLKIDLIGAAYAKMADNDKRYPVAKCHGKVIKRTLRWKDIDHLGCIDCENFDGDRELEEGNCMGELKDFCKEHFNAGL